MKELIVQIPIDRQEEFSGYEVELVRYICKLLNGDVIVGHHVCGKGYTIKKGEVWYYKTLDTQNHVILTEKKEDIHPRVLTFLPYEPARKFEELKQFCLFYHSGKKSHAIFIKVSDSKALLLEDNHKNDAFIVSGETIVIPYYLQPTSRVQKEAIEKVLDNYHMTE